MSTGKSLKEILEQFNRSKEEQVLKEEQEIKEREERLRKAFEHRRYLDKIYESLSPSAGAGAGAGAGGTRFINKPINQAPSFIPPTALSEGVFIYGHTLVLGTVSTGDIYKIESEFYLTEDLSNTGEGTLLPIFNIKENDSAVNNSSGKYNMGFGKLPDNVKNVIVGESFYILNNTDYSYVKFDDLVPTQGLHRVILTYNEQLSIYDMEYDGKVYDMISNGTYSPINVDDYFTNKKFFVIGRMAYYYSPASAISGNYIKNITFYDSSDNIIFKYDNNYYPNLTYYTDNGYDFLAYNILDTPEVNSPVTLNCTISSVAYETEYQNVVDFWTSQGYVLPTSEVRDAQNVLIKTLVDNNIWAKLDRFFLFSANGDLDTKLTDYVNTTKYNIQPQADSVLSHFLDKGVGGVAPLNHLFDADSSSFNNFDINDYTIGVSFKPSYGYATSGTSLIGGQTQNFITNVGAQANISFGINEIAMAFSKDDRMSYTYSLTQHYNTIITLTQSVAQYNINGDYASQSVTISNDSSMPFNITIFGNAGDFFIGFIVGGQSPTMDSIHRAAFVGSSLTVNQQAILNNALDDYYECIGATVSTWSN